MGSYEFWRKVKKWIGMTDGSLTKYAYITQTIESIARMEADLSHLKEHLTDDNDKLEYFHKVTGLTCHPLQNNPHVLSMTMESFVQQFNLQYQKHVSEGTLQKFFSQAFNTFEVCFEARARQLFTFTQKNPIADESIGVDTDLIPDYTSDSPMETVFNEELRILVLKLSKSQEFNPTIDSVTPSQFKNYLINDISILTFESMKDNKKCKITMNDIDSYITYAQELCMIADSDV
jgi:hypothetical protein